jgi:polysaccharide biosynthesis/export protein
MMSILLYRLVLVTFILGGCARLPPLPPPVLTPPVPASVFQQFKQAYLIGPEDVISIIVYGHGELSTQVSIAADGTFSYPLLGQVQAAGLTTKELEARLVKFLSEYIVNPQISVTVAQFLSQRVYVLGEVRASGAQNLPHTSTLLEILAKAGGPTPDAGRDVVIVRASETQEEAPSSANVTKDISASIRIDLERLMAGEIPRPIQIFNGDTVYIPRATYYYISGEINRPGRYRLERDTTVAKALTVAGGLTRFATKSRITVRRLVGGEMKEFHAEQNDMLQSEDEIIVPQSVF